MTEPRTITLAQRLLAGTTPGFGGCIIRTTGITARGYGVLRVSGQRVPAHRLAYELFVGPIPSGLEVDHRCHNVDTACAGGDRCPHRRCINPAHLEPVTTGENARRSPLTQVGRNIRMTRCANGHPFDAANTYIRPDGGGRVCRQCRADRMRAYTAAQRAARPSDLPTCGHISRAGNACSRPPGHIGKHQTQNGAAR